MDGLHWDSPNLLVCNSSNQTAFGDKLEVDQEKVIVSWKEVEMCRFLNLEAQWGPEMWFLMEVALPLFLGLQFHDVVAATRRKPSLVMEG